MRIAYLSTDEVNLALAAQMAEACDCQLYPLSPRDAAPDGSFGAVLCDLDYWPPERRQTLLAELQTGPTPRSTVVHSYNLSEEQAAALRASGIVVHRRLGLEVFLLLLEDAEPIQARESLNQEHDTRVLP
jgi:hypothetical protein